MMSEHLRDKRLVVREPFAFKTVDVPARFTGCDIIEIRVSLTPLRWSEADRRHERAEGSDIVGAQVQIVQLEARDSRAVFSILRQLLRSLVREYLDLKDVF